jgi:hypothetical protein
MGGGWVAGVEVRKDPSEPLLSMALPALSFRLPQTAFYGLLFKAKSMPGSEAPFQQACS